MHLLRLWDRGLYNSTRTTGGSSGLRVGRSEEVTVTQPFLSICGFGCYWYQVCKAPSRCAKNMSKRKTRGGILRSWNQLEKKNEQDIREAWDNKNMWNVHFFSPGGAFIWGGPGLLLPPSCQKLSKWARMNLRKCYLALSDRTCVALGQQ